MLQTKIANIKLANCIYNASGPACSSLEELQALGQSAAGAILSKSATLAPRAGNPAPRYVDTPWGSINSMGLPNKGHAYYLAAAKELASFQKPYIVSLSGMSLADNLKMIAEMQEEENIAAIELNLSCPNLPGKPQTAYDFEQTEKVLAAVFAQNNKPLGVKLPPYFDLLHFEQMAQILNQFPLSFVSCINSIGNGLVIDWEKEETLIRPKDGFGGLGGDYIKATALANVRQFYLLLRPEISVVAVGGIKSGQDAFEHILCGAKAVQIGTHLMKTGPSCFAQISAELTAIMQAKGYQSIEDFRGKLKTAAPI
ncbi:dihydroorotate oxidase [Saprospira grandis]|uniref:Dihydroorotate dehydrogenase n=1 Tax=Saprospira grandis (strain Lewin) TaxID=984262 RepID=H6LAX7_SAPGL|nr:dihydroorotate oxidase [Saprospira grandis]AFC26942.1 dihydroorotate dehydrogenase 1A [Saprospira grandis str. Lewin]